MRILRPDDLAEQFVRDAAAELTLPKDSECLVCFVDRMLREFDCDNTLRFARRFRDRRAPRSTALERRLGGLGGFCDCEILLNAYEPAERLWSPASEVDCETGGAVVYDAEPPQQMPPCGGVRRGATDPCDHWQPIRRGRW